MVGHPIYSDIDPDLPASSAPATYELLRSWGFDGVAVTDALGMVGARAGRTIEETAVDALTAGADLLIIEDPAARESTVDAIVAAIDAGTLNRSRLAQAAHRVRILASWTAGYTTECRASWTRE